MLATAIYLRPCASSSDGDSEFRVERAHAILGDRGVIPGRHCQCEEVFGHALFYGDTSKLPRRAADSKAGYIFETLTGTEPGSRWPLRIEPGAVKRISIAPKVAENIRVARRRRLEL